MKFRIKILFITTFLTSLSAQNYKAAAVAFYNVENLFDTIISTGYIDGTKKPYHKDYHLSIDAKQVSELDTTFTDSYNYYKIKGKKIIRPLILQEEFSIDGQKNWNSKKYQIKIQNITRVIGQIGREVTQNAPVIVGLAEIENKNVLKDLIHHPNLEKYNYDFVHFNSLDARGIDCGLLYQTKRFQPVFSKAHELRLFSERGRNYTRDILQVSGYLDGEKIHFLVNHWPSRRGGQVKSEPFRIKAAELLQKIVKEIQDKEKDAKIILMGDFNDNPTDQSLSKVFTTKKQKENVSEGDFFNPMIQQYKKGIGSNAYRDIWSLFDQMILSGSLVDHQNTSEYKAYRTSVFAPSFLTSPTGRYKGYPYRSYAGDTFREEGYSDHFPVYTILLKPIN